MGIVAGFDYLFKNREDKDYEAIYFEQVERRPEVKRRIANATRCDVFRVQKEYSYHSRQPAGDGWVLVGDAFGFLDPLYSSGVLLALNRVSSPPTRLPRDSRKTTRRPPNSANGAPNSKPAWIACGDWSSSTTKASVSAASSRGTPTQKGHLTDLLIGDLFRPAHFDETFRLIDELKAEQAKQPN